MLKKSFASSFSLHLYSLSIFLSLCFFYFSIHVTTSASKTHDLLHTRTSSNHEDTQGYKDNTRTQPVALHIKTHVNLLLLLVISFPFIFINLTSPTFISIFQSLLHCPHDGSVPSVLSFTENEELLFSFVAMEGSDWSVTLGKRRVMGQFHTW